MWKSGWEAMPMDRPSSIHRAAPRARVRSTSEMATSPARTSAGTSAELRSHDGVVRARDVLGRATEAIDGTVVRAWEAAGPWAHPVRRPDRCLAPAAGLRAER